MKNFNFVRGDSVLPVLCCVLSFTFGILIGNLFHPTTRVLSRREFPCTMPIILSGEPECIRYEKKYEPKN